MASTLQFARLIFDTKLQHFETNNREEYNKIILLKVIDYDTPIVKLLSKAGKNIHIIDATWNFAGIKEGILDNIPYIYGKLGKESTQTHLVRDNKKKDYVLSETTDAYVIYFLIDLKKNVLVYESKRNVGEKAPLDIIKDVFNSYYDDKEELEIEIITDKRKIVERMNRLSTLDIVDLNVYRTNPESTSGSDKMDTFLREGHIRRLHLKAYSDKKGIQLNKVDLIKSGFHLAEEGYGSAKAIGKIGDNYEEIVTGDIPIKIDTNLTKDDDQINIKTLLYQIREALKRLEDKLNK